MMKHACAPGFTLIEAVVVIVILMAIVGIAAVRWKSPDHLRTLGVAQQVKEFLVRGPERSKASPFGVVLNIRNPDNLPAAPNNHVLSFQEYASSARTTLTSAYPTEAVIMSDVGLSISSSFATPTTTDHTRVIFRTNGLVQEPLQTTAGYTLGGFDIMMNGVALHRVVFAPGSGSPMVQVCVRVTSSGGAEQGQCPNTASGWCDAEVPQEDCLLP